MVHAEEEQYGDVPLSFNKNVDVFIVFWDGPTTYLTDENYMIWFINLLYGLWETKYEIKSKSLVFKDIINSHPFYSFLEGMLFKSKIRKHRHKILLAVDTMAQGITTNCQV